MMLSNNLGDRPAPKSTQQDNGPTVYCAEPRLPISEALQEALAICKVNPEEQTFDGTEKRYWLKDLISREEMLPRKESQKALSKLYLEAQSPETAKEIRTAIEQFAPGISGTVEWYRNMFGALEGDSARELEPQYEDEVVAEEALEHVFSALFKLDFRFQRPYARQDIRYDPARFLAGLELMEYKLEDCAGKNSYLQALLQDLQRVRTSAFHAEYDQLVQQYSPSQSEQFGDSYIRDYWSDNAGSQLSQIRSWDGYDLEPQSLIRNGYITWNEEQQREIGEERQDFASLSAKLARDYGDTFKLLESVINRFEYLCLWSNISEKSDYQTCKAALEQDNSELSIQRLKSPAMVLKHMSSDKEVVPNNFTLGGEIGSLTFIGANGCGKTQLLAGVVNSVCKAHRGAPTFATRVDCPVMSGLVYGVNLSQHSNRGSSFQNEVDAIIKSLKDLEQERRPGEPALLILDEPFRGTDVQDALPLLAGLMAYCQEHDILLAFSTHVSDLGKSGEILEKMGIKNAVYTLNDQHEMIPGPGKSRGIEKAEDLALQEEITNNARTIRAGQEKQQIAPLERIAKEPHSAATPMDSLSKNLLTEGGLYEIEYDQRNGNRITVGPHTQVFAKYAPFGTLDHNQEDDSWSFAYLDRRYSTNFMTQLLDEQNTIEQKTLEFLFNSQTRAELTNTLKPLLNAVEYFQAPQVNPSDFDEPFELTSQEFRKSFAEYEQFCRFLGNTRFNPGFKKIEELQALAEAIDRTELSRIDPRFAQLRNALDSKEFKAIEEFLQNNDIPDRAANPPSTKDWEQWKTWHELTKDLAQQLKRVQQQLSTLNFYTAIAGTIANENWVKVTDGAAGEFLAEDLLNVGLAGELGGKDNVTKNDVECSPTTPLQAITGTNGGGKTQYLQAIAAALCFAKRLGYVPASMAKMGELSFIDLHINAGEHSDEQSSFEDEVQRIKHIIDDYEARGCPENGIILLDEPFKGTSEEDAAPLLLALMKYFSDRNVQVIFTTHYSSIFPLMEKLDDQSQLNCRPLYVDYFSKDEQFKVKEGRGESSGIRVAAERGLSEDFLKYVREFQELYQQAQAA